MNGEFMAPIADLIVMTVVSNRLTNSAKTIARMVFSRVPNAVSCIRSVVWAAE